MNFSFHLKVGVTISSIMSGAVLLINGNFPLAIYSGVLTLVGSILPDLDTDSIPSRWAARCGVIFTIYCVYIKLLMPAVIAGLIFFIVKSDHHRGFTHKYLMPSLLITFGLYFGNMLSVAFGFGIICHLMFDGIRPLYLKNWV